MWIRYIDRYRDNSGKIIGYRLQDENGNIQDISAIELKNLISTNKIVVHNLTLTSDGRLLPTTPKIEKGPDFKKKDFDKEMSKLIDDIASKAAALIGMYKYNTDIDKITKLQNVNQIHGDMYSQGHNYITDYQVYYYPLGSVPEELEIIIEKEERANDKVTIRTNDVTSDVCLLKNNDVLDKFENELRNKYKIKQSIKASSIAHKLSKTENSGDTNKKVSIFNLFKR